MLLNSGKREGEGAKNQPKKEKGKTCHTNLIKKTIKKQKKKKKKKIIKCKTKFHLQSWAYWYLTVSRMDDLYYYVVLLTMKFVFRMESVDLAFSYFMTQTTTLSCTRNSFDHKEIVSIMESQFDPGHWRVKIGL